MEAVADACGRAVCGGQFHARPALAVVDAEAELERIAGGEAGLGVRDFRPGQGTLDDPDSFLVSNLELARLDRRPARKTYPPLGTS